MMYRRNDNPNRPDMYRWDKGDNFHHIGSEYFVNRQNINRKSEPPADYGELHLKEDNDNESLDSEGKQKSFTRLCVRFAEKTSMQGIPYINAAKLWYAKALWLVLLLGGITGMTLHLYFLIDQYTDFDVQVSVELGFSNLDFPAVTICNVNAIKKSQMSHVSTQLQSLVDQTDPGKVTPQAPTGRRKRFIDDFDRINFDNLTTNYKDPNKQGTKDSTYQIQEAFQTLYMDEKPETRREVGHQMKDMLLQCSFAGYECYASNFTLIQTEEYGNCYMIQSSDFKVTNSGPDNGLSLTLYMETEEYLTGINQGYGARILIHEIDSYPFPATEGMYISSSFESHIGLKQVSITRETEPYGNCVDVGSYKTQYGATYTRRLCQAFCKQNQIISRCNCFDNQASDIFHTLNISFTSASPCRTDSEMTCLYAEKSELETDSLNCPECSNPCQEHQFVKSISARNWPTDDYVNVLMQGVCEKLPAEKCARITAYSGDMRSLGQNFVKVVVYFEDLNYEQITEVPEIEVQQFASDVGGAIGLWIGLSIISMFELVQLLLECLAFGVHKCRSPQTKKKSQDKYEETYKAASGRNETRIQQQISPKINGNFDPYRDWNINSRV